MRNLHIYIFTSAVIPEYYSLFYIMLNQQLAWSMEYFFILPRDHSHLKMWKELSLENNKKFLGLGLGSSITRNMRKNFLLEKYKETFSGLELDIVPGSPNT